MKFITWFLIVVLLAAGVWYVASNHRKSPLPVPDTAAEREMNQGKAQQAIRAQVTAFGNVLQNVSLLSSTVASDIERDYAPYVTRSLRSLWETRPDTALGRQTASPWPDRIDVVSIDAAPHNTFTVRALVVYMTSEEIQKGADAGTITMQLIMIEEDGHWKIDGVTMLQQNKPNAPRSLQDKPQLQ